MGAPADSPGSPPLPQVHRLVLLRHGESVWNSSGLFTGWVDVGLSERGAAEATAAGELLARAQLLPDVVHTSVLARSIATAELALAAADRRFIPVRRSWRLNERHYGALQGKGKEEIRLEFGEEQFMLWRRSYDVPPPPLAPGSELDPALDPRYRLLAPDSLPRSECLKDVLQRALPYWYDAIVPDLRSGQVVLVSAHGNSLRALVKHLDGISDDAIAAVNLPTGIPLLYELDGQLRPLAPLDPRFGVSGSYLDPEAAASSIEQVKNQGQTTRGMTPT
jgi:2,3-bisphosphoglycerate-dependent phosphoglycerate mutase